jgi:hypothetical protein
MSRTARTPEEIIDAWLGTAPQAKLERLQSDVRAVLRWKFGVGEPPAPARKPRKGKDGAQPKPEGTT